MAASHPDDSRGVAARYRRVMEPQALDMMRRFFHSMNRGMVLVWRLGLGRLAGAWPRGFGRLLVIEHVGWRSGSMYRTPVNYTVVGEDLYCVAAFGQRTDWYRNALAAPGIAVWLPDGRWEGQAADASDDPRRLALIRRVLIDSGFAAPLFGLYPHRLSDDELADATRSYRLLRIRPGERRSTAPGPGDLAWMWVPIGAAAGLLTLLRARRARGRTVGSLALPGAPAPTRFASPGS